MATKTPQEHWDNYVKTVYPSTKPSDMQLIQLEQAFVGGMLIMVLALTEISTDEDEDKCVEMLQEYYDLVAIRCMELAKESFKRSMKRQARN